MTLDQIPNGGHFLVRKVTVVREVGKRLADMGFIRGASGRVVRRGLLGDPIQIFICHYHVSIRCSEARGIAVEAVDKNGPAVHTTTGGKI